MRIAPIAPDERQRLDLLNSLELFDTAPEPVFDEITRLLTRLLKLPVALVTLIDERRQWFKSRQGVEVLETPREFAFCAHAILRQQAMVVSDTLQDERFRDNPLVTGSPHIRAYAGVPLRSREGLAFGTLCAIDQVPRTFSPEELGLLDELAGIVQRELQRREAAQELRQSSVQALRSMADTEAHCHATFELAPVGIALVGLDGRMTRCNAKLCEILQRPPEELAGLGFQDITYPEDLAGDLAQVDRLLAGKGRSYSLEKRYVRRDGGLVWARLTVTLVRHDGAPDHFIAVVEDIGDRKVAEQSLADLHQQLEERVATRTAELQRSHDELHQKKEALRQREADLRAILEGAQEAFVAMDAQGHVIDWNRQAEQTFGWTRDEVMGRPLDELIVPSMYRDAHRAGLQRMNAGARATVLNQRLELPAQCKNGELILCELTITCLKSDGRNPVFAAFLHDISERKLAEQRLAASEQRLNAIVNDQTDIVCRLDAEGYLVFANPAARRVFGLDAQREPRGVHWKSAVHPPDLAQVLEQLRQLRPEHPSVTTEYRICGADTGALRWVEFINHAFYDDLGTLTEIQSVGRDTTERKRLQAELAEASARLQDLYDHAPCGYYSVDADGHFVQINRTALRWLACTEQEALGGLGPADFLDEATRAQFKERFHRFMADGRFDPVDLQLQARDGDRRRVSISASAVRDEQGRFLMSRSIMYDITELDRARDALQRLTREQHLMLDSELIGIMKFRERVCTWVNRAMERMLGYGPGELNGQSARIIYPDDATFERVGREAYPDLHRGGTYRLQVQLMHRSGERLWVDMSGVLLSEETGESMWLMLDIGVMKQYQDQVEQLAFHDALTGLPNRLLLRDRLIHGIAQVHRGGGVLALCYIDLDGFKAVNDTHGHEAGDLVLREVAARLQHCVRGSDTLARLGGDEFVVLLSPLPDAEHAKAILRRMLEALAVPIALGPQAWGQVSASIGVALHPRDGGDPGTLLAQADEAMYLAKRAGKNRYAFCP